MSRNVFVIHGALEKHTERLEIACRKDDAALDIIERQYELLKELEAALLAQQREITTLQLTASVKNRGV